MNPVSKVLVVYHRQAMVVSDDVYTPVLAGAAVTSSKCKDGKLFLDPEFLAGMRFRDDSGDNVSEMNRAINEMSVVYWAWKHYAELGNPDSIGLAHYRRFLVSDESLPLPRRRWFPGSEMYVYDDESSFRAAISSDRLKSLLKESEVLCPYRYSAANLKEGARLACCRDRFVQMLGEDKGGLYDEMERLVLAARPDLRSEIEYMRSHSDHYVCNMFVMPREEFFRYCEFMFPIIFRLAEMNAGETDVERMRAPGFLSEFLTSLYLSGIVREGRLRVKTLRMACWGISAHGFLRKIIRALLTDAARHKLKKVLGIK